MNKNFIPYHQAKNYPNKTSYNKKNYQNGNHQNVNRKMSNFDSSSYTFLPPQSISINQITFSPEEMMLAKEFILEKRNQEQIDKQVLQQMEIEKRLNELKYQKSKIKEEEDISLAKELRLEKKKVVSLEEELKELKEEFQELKEKYNRIKAKNKKLKEKRKVEKSSSDEETSEIELESPGNRNSTKSIEQLKKTIEDKINGNITLLKIKKLGSASIKSICEDHDVVYSTLNQAANLIYDKIK